MHPVGSTINQNFGEQMNQANPLRENLSLQSLDATNYHLLSEDHRILGQRHWEMPVDSPECLNQVPKILFIADVFMSWSGAGFVLGECGDSIRAIVAVTGADVSSRQGIWHLTGAPARWFQVTSFTVFKVLHACEIMKEAIEVFNQYVNQKRHFICIDPCDFTKVISGIKFTFRPPSKNGTCAPFKPTCFLPPEHEELIARFPTGLRRSSAHSSRRTGRGSVTENQMSRFPRRLLNSNFPASSSGAQFDRPPSIPPMRTLSQCSTFRMNPRMKPDVMNSKEPLLPAEPQFISLNIPSINSGSSTLGDGGFPVTDSDESFPSSPLFMRTQSKGMLSPRISAMSTGGNPIEERMMRNLESQLKELSVEGVALSHTIISGNEARVPSRRPERSYEVGSYSHMGSSSEVKDSTSSMNCHGKDQSPPTRDV